MQVTPSDVKYSPLPTNEWLNFEITDEKEQPNYFDKKKMVLNVEFSIAHPGLDRRKVWRNFGPYWPKSSSEKTTQFFELVKAVDPANAIKGQDYDSNNLRGKKGRLMMVDYEAKEKEPEMVEVEIKGVLTEITNPRAGQPIIKQKVDRITSLGTPAGPAPVAVPEVDEAPVKKVKF